MVSCVRLRKRILIHYLEYASPANAILTADCQELCKQQNVQALGGQERLVPLKQQIDQLVVGLDKLLEELIWMDKVVVSAKGRKVAPWLLAAEDRLVELAEEEQVRLRKAIQEVLVGSTRYFKPFRYQPKFSEELFSWK